MSDRKMPSRASSRATTGSSRLRHLPLFSRKKTQTQRVLDPQHISPKHDQQNHAQTPAGDLDIQLGNPVSPQPAFGAPDEEEGRATSAVGGRSASPPSVFDDPQQPPEITETNTTQTSTSVEEQFESYDLNPPPPKMSQGNVEALAARLFSPDHLDLILRDQTLSWRLNKFLATYRPELAQDLERYVETKKAITAIDYANAVAQRLSGPEGQGAPTAAVLNDKFVTESRNIVQGLVETALPAYVTYRLVQLTTDALVKEITGNNAPIMRELIPSLAEVYCITDPSLPDNPIVYASDEFYNTTQYGREFVIGRNCRFLQGPSSTDSTVRRLIESITAGQETCETILNYRRDGSPFMNLLMIAPLYDNKGQVRYFLGCQVDVSYLIEDGRGLESFSALLSQDRSGSGKHDSMTSDPSTLLSGLGQMLNDHEGNRVMAGAMASSSDLTKNPMLKNSRGRRVLGMEDHAEDRPMFAPTSLGPSGRLPGVYKNYLLVRPYPSLRITFTSPALRIPGLVQTKFLDRIGGPSHVREGILDALTQGAGVTARITWLNIAPNQSDSQSQGSNFGDNESGKPRWIHCTPLLGSDEEVGVWMVVMVEKEEVTGLLNRQDWAGTGNGLGRRGSLGAASHRFTGNKLYAEYKKREGVEGSRPGTASSPMEKKDGGKHFDDF